MFSFIMEIDYTYLITCLTTFRFHTGTTAILSVFAFLFLIPFVVDPAISVIVADYEQSPVTCMVTDHVFGEGLRNCTWSSCREGCTTAATKYGFGDEHNFLASICLCTSTFQMPSNASQLLEDIVGGVANGTEPQHESGSVGRGRHKTADQL